jgi:hypothetical protein
MNDIIPPELLNKPLNQWQLDLLTIFILSQVVGRAYKGLKTQGGLRGIIHGIWFGTNQPTKDTNENTGNS